MSQNDLMVGSEMVLYGVVGADLWGDEHFTARDVVAALAGATGDITVRINSGGGVATEGAAIYSALRAHAGSVRVIIDGAAASAASLIAMAGDEIVMREGAFLLIHDPASMWTAGRGTADDHTHTAGMLDKIGQTYAAIYAKRAGITTEEARAIMKAESVYGPDDAVAAGFATAVDALPAAAAASFPYHIYAHAPEGLRAASRGSAGAPTRETIMASMVGIASNPSNKREPVMAADGEMTVATEAPVEEVISETPEVETNEPEPVAQASSDLGIRAERERARRIIDATAAARLPVAFATDLIESGVSFEEAHDAITAEFKKGGDPVEYPKRASAQVVSDGRDRFRAGVTDAIMAKAGLGGERNEFCSMSLLEMARASLENSGIRVSASSRLEVAGTAFNPRMAGAAHSTSDFPAILENVANKAMLRGFEEQEETFGAWTSTGSASDFKIGKRVGMNVFPALQHKPEGAEYHYATVGDYGESVVVATYGQMFGITREAIVNDDLSVFTRIPQRMGRAARRTVGNLVYGVLTGNPAMGDGVALFHADHGNLGTGAAPAVGSMEAAIAKMATQKDRSDNATALNIRPAYILAPYALRGTVMQVLESEYDPSKSTRAANTVRNAVTPIFDARLDQASTTAWYLSASPSVGDTIEVTYLDGNEVPYLESKDGWSTDGVEFKVRIDAGVTPLAWEGLFKNPGA